MQVDELVDVILKLGLFAAITNLMDANDAHIRATSIRAISTLAKQSEYLPHHIKSLLISIPGQIRQRIDESILNRINSALKADPDPNVRATSYETMSALVFQGTIDQQFAREIKNLSLHPGIMGFMDAEDGGTLCAAFNLLLTLIRQGMSTVYHIQ